MHLSTKSILSDPNAPPALRNAVLESLRKQPDKPAALSQQQPSPLEEKFLDLWRQIDGPQLDREFCFADPARKFRFDFVHLPSMVVIELEGGAYAAKGRHFTAKGFEQDAVKYNLATLMGYHVFRLTGRLLTVQSLRPIVARCVGK